MAKNKSFRPPGARRPLWWGLGAASALFILGFCFFTPFYQNADDVAMSWLARGMGMALHPTEFLCFINVLVGLALKGLYFSWPGVHWYGLFLFSLLFLSTWALAAVAVLKARSMGHGVLMLLVFLPFFVRCFAWPQYTLLCFLCAQAGIFLFLNPAKPEKLSLALASGLLLASSLLRFEAFGFSLLLSLPYWVYVRQRDGESPLLPLRRSFLLAAGCLVLGAWAFDLAYYSAHPGWNEARAYMAAHNALDEDRVPDYEKNRAAFQAAGWSRNDFQMFVDWFYLGPKFDLGTIRKILPSVPRLSAGKWVEFQNLFELPAVWFYLAAFVLCLLRYGRKGGLPLRNGCWTLAGVGLALFLKKIVTRGFFPHFFYGAAVCLLEGEPGGSKRDRWSGPAMGIVLLALAAWSVQNDYAKDRPGPVVERLLRDSMDHLAPRQNQLFVVWGSSFPFPAASVFGDPGAFKDFNVVWLSWLQRTPATGEMLLKFGIGDLAGGMVDRPDVFLIFDPGRPTYTDYMKENYGLSITAEPAFRGPLFSAYRIRSVKAGPTR